MPSEWGPNLHAFADRGLRITEIATHADGAVDLAALERMLAPPGTWTGSARACLPSAD